jgi:putative ubiquitin-RnfH superfamily antitoxin RatB of RatAB toxin-antitoxin module
MDSSELRITVAFCAPGVEDVSEVKLPLGSTVRDAIAAARLHERRPELKDPIDAGIWGRRCSLDQPLTQGDRVEIYRPLVIDPMEGRRVRADLRRRGRLKA